MTELAIVQMTITAFKSILFASDELVSQFNCQAVQSHKKISVYYDVHMHVWLEAGPYIWDTSSYVYFMGWAWERPNQREDNTIKKEQL